MSISLVLPVPPSANRYWRNWRGKMVRSEEADDYRKLVRFLIMRDFDITPIDKGEVDVDLWWYRGTLQGDTDNRIKVILDSLNGVIWKDDKQVRDIHIRRRLDRQNPRLVVSWNTVDT